MQRRSQPFMRWLDKLPGAPSLRRQLLVWLLLPQLVLWIAGALFSYKLAERYANQAVDASLSQASRALARQVKPIGKGLFIDFPRAAQDILESDPNDRVLYTVSTPPGKFILGNRNLPPPPSITAPVIGAPYFYDGVINAQKKPLRGAADNSGVRVRVAALYLHYGDEGGPDQVMLVQVARSSANREELAHRILVDMLLPLSGLMVLMTMIVWAGIRAGLAPLALLRRQVEGRAANDLAPISLEAAPTEVYSLARAVNALLLEVNRNVAAQKRFISDASHQLRTPLAGLKSQTELALREATDPSLVARLERVKESATRSAHLVNQLLSLARTEPEAVIKQSRSTIDMHRLACDVTASIVPRALQAGVDLGFEESDSSTGLELQGIELLLREALVNLIDNAIRYAGSGASVTVRVYRQPGSICVEVEDDGPGLSEEDCDRVFERFVRATHDGTGCGLGLSIVREIVERHGGTVRLETTLPHGLKARMTLPALDAGKSAKG